MEDDYPSDWESRRKKVYERDSHKCQNCGRRGGEHGIAELHAHHIVPKSKGGTHKKSNLISVCKQCHSAIHDDDFAPTAGTGNDLQEFKRLVNRLQKFLQHLQQGPTVESPGEFQNDELEKERKSLIQDLGQFSMTYNAPDDKREQIMNEIIQALVELLRYPEDAWEKLESGELTRDETKEYGERITKERSQKFSEAVNKAMSIGLDRFF